MKTSTKGKKKTQGYLHMENLFTTEEKKYSDNYQQLKSHLNVQLRQH